jgi:hypothetical protein
MREREFLKPWQEARPDSFFTLAAQRRVLEQVTGAGATRIDFGIFLEATDELVGRIQLSGIAPARSRAPISDTPSRSGTSDAGTPPRR